MWNGSDGLRVVEYFCEQVVRFGDIASDFVLFIILGVHVDVTPAVGIVPVLVVEGQPICPCATAVIVDIVVAGPSAGVRIVVCLDV